MKLSILLSLFLCCTASLYTQRTLAILPPEVSVYREQKINIFKLKHDITKAIMTDQEEDMQARYERLVLENMNFIFAEPDVQIDFVRDVKEFSDSMQHQIFRLSRLITRGEMNRNYQKKYPPMSFNSVNQTTSNKKWRKSNEAAIQPLAEAFAREVNCRYILQIRITGQHKRRDDSPNIYGGICYESIIIDSTTGKTVYYNDFWQGKRALKHSEELSNNNLIRINLPIEIKPKQIKKGVSRMLRGAFNKHKLLARAMKKE